MSSNHAPGGETGGLAMLEKASSALSTDFCPWANRYVYWLKNPFWVLMLAIGGSLACGIFITPFVFLLTGLLVFVTAAGVALPWIAVRGISCHVMFDVPRTQVGRPAIVRLKVQNRWPIPVWGLSLIKGFAHDESTDGNEGVALARVPGRSAVEYSWSFVPCRRGVYPRDAAEVETGFPFGLYRAAKAVSVDGRLIVWPATVALDGMPDASQSQQTDDQYSDRRVGEFGDAMGTRLFRSGDSLRRVHWAQTARQQTLIVTERQAPAMSSVRVILDIWEGHHPPGFRDETIELSVGIAASICDSLHRQHCRVELIIGRTLMVAGDAASGFNRVMDTLAVADAQADKPAESSRRHGFEILVTTDAGYRAGHRRQIIVGDSDNEAWVVIANKNDLNRELPAHWRRLCHER